MRRKATEAKRESEWTDVDAYERRREEFNRKVRAENEARRIAFEAKRVAEEKDPSLWQGGPRPA
jgi:hypothetical protein